jgi:hypothetical protein
MSDTPKHSPGPLRVDKKHRSDPRQASVVSDYSLIDGDWEDIYVDFSGFFGSYGPDMFAAAPEMLEALKEANIATMLYDGHEGRYAKIIAKAEGRQP